MKIRNFDNRRFLLTAPVVESIFVSRKAVICLSLCFSFVFLFVISTAAQKIDERWLYVTSDVGNTRQYFIDKQTLLKDSSPTDPVKSVWSKSLFADGSFQIDKTLWDCKLRRTRFLITGFYQPDGELIKRYEVNGKWAEIGPDSIGERILQTVCQLAETAGVDKSAKSKKDAGDDRPNKSGRLVEVITNRANIRVAPSMDARVFAQSNRSEIFVLADLTAVKGWYQIQFTDENRQQRIGWIHGSTIKFVEIESRDK